jgi:hypothetical protein
VSVERWAWGSVGVNVVLAALHGLLAVTSGSLGVTAELVHAMRVLLDASVDAETLHRIEAEATRSWRR